MTPHKDENDAIISSLQQQLEEMELTIQALTKKNQRLAFAVERLKDDKSITENFVNVTIADLEEANKKLQTYRQKELEEKDRTIQLQEIQLKQITDAMPYCMAFVSKDGRYQITNKAYASWFNQNNEIVKNRHVKDLHGEERFIKVIQPIMEKCLSGENVITENYYTDKNGNDIFLYAIHVPAYDLNKNIIGIYIYVQDITQLKLNEQAIQEKNKELEKYIESNLQLENFAFLASHDLRSPLNNVLNFTKLLKKTALHKLDAREQKSLEFIDESTARMQQFIEDLLSYSVSTNKEVTFTEINLSELLEEILTDIFSSLKSSNAYVCWHDLPKTILGDRVLIKQLFQNLICNANKFRDQYRNPQIDIGYHKKNKNYLFYVKDNGIGIEKDEQKLIFGIFKRLHLRSEYDGTGIGLSTCKNAVKKHGGQIWVESTVNKGSTFYFTIPIKPQL